MNRRVIAAEHSFGTPLLNIYVLRAHENPIRHLIKQSPARGNVKSQVHAVVGGKGKKMLLPTSFQFIDTSNLRRPIMLANFFSQ